MSNYPPGTSAGDPRAPWNAPDRSHDHEFIDVDGPIFEDGAAMFSAECNYAEGRYGEGWECEETVWWRCSAERIIHHRDDQPDISFLLSEARFSGPYTPAKLRVENAIMAIEKAARADELELVHVDPANTDGEGYVRARAGDVSVVYTQDRS